MTPADPNPESLHRCDGGPSHDEGEAFEFDGRPPGLESGVYRLLGDVYTWEPAGAAVVKLLEPPAEE